MKRVTSSLAVGNSSSCPETGRSIKDKLTGAIQKKDVNIAKKKSALEEKRATRLKSTQSVAGCYEDRQNPVTATSGKELSVVLPGKKRRAFEDMGNKNAVAIVDPKRQKKTWLSSVKSSKIIDVKGKKDKEKDKENVVKLKLPKKSLEKKPSESKPSTGKAVKSKKKASHNEVSIPVPCAMDKQRRDSNWDLDNLRKAIDNLMSEPPEGVINIDEQCTDYFFCPEYAMDIMTYLKDREKQYQIGREFLKDDPEVNPNMRSILIDWLLQVQTHLSLTQETLHITVAMIDLFLQKKRVQLNKLQLLGITSLLIASKFEERYAPSVNKLIRLTDNTYKYNQVMQNELLVLKTLKFMVNPPIAVTFLERYLLCLPVSRTLEYLSRYIIDLAIHDFQCVEYLPSLRAAAAIYLARRILKKCPPEETWTGELWYYSGYGEENLYSCVQRFARLLLKAEKSKFQGAREKYNSYGNYKSVSGMPSLCSSIVQDLAVGKFP